MLMGGRRNALKISLLLFTLVTPVVLYLFLQGFGENIYKVPIYFENGINRDTTNCNLGDKQHIVQFVTLKADHQNQTEYKIFNQKLTVVDINNEASEKKLGEIGYSLNRVADTFVNEKLFQILIIQPDTVTQLDKKNASKSNLIRLRINQKKILEFARCGLILLDFPETRISSWNKRFVLIDQAGRIRGYYYAHDFQEIDRLILEIKIILEEEY